MKLRISDLLDDIQAPDYLEPVPDPELEQRMINRLRPQRRGLRPLRMSLIAACLSVLLLTAAVATGLTLTIWLRGELAVPESAAYEEYGENTFSGADFDVTVLSAASGESYAQVFVALTGLPEESREWSFTLQRMGDYGPAVFGSATVMEYMIENETLILELGMPMMEGKLELGLSYVSEDYSSWMTRFSLALPETDYCSVALSLPAETMEAAADSLDISLNSMKLHLNVPGAEEDYEIHSHRADYPKAVWDGNQADYAAWQQSLLREFGQVTVCFSDGTSREFSLEWQGEPGKDGVCILETVWTRGFLDLSKITAVTLGGRTVTLEK